MALHVGHNCTPWEDCDVCGAKVEPPYRQRGGQERTKNMARLVGAYETIDHREVNGWTVTLFRNVSHNGTQPHGSYSASVRENASENVLSFYGDTREAVEREVLRIVGVSPPDAAALVEENAALRAENERLRETLQALVDEKLVCNVREGDGSYIDVSAWCRAVLNGEKP